MNTTFKLLSMIAACGLAALAPAPGANAQTLYSVRDLGMLPGYATSFPLGLNERGDVVGVCTPATSNLNQTGFIWRNGVMTSTGLLPKGNYSAAAAINASGVVVGDGDTGNFRPQSWVTGRGGLANFFQNNGGNTHAIGIQDTGEIWGYYTKSLSGRVASWRGATWRPDPKDSRKFITTVLPVLVGPDPLFDGTTAIPAASNQNGQAAGYATNEVIGQHAALWNNDAAHTIVDLGTLPGDWSSLAHGINDLGQVVGDSHPPFGSVPTLWDCDAAHTPIALPLLPGDNYGSATAINSLGEILGTSAASVPFTWNVGPSRIVLWRDGGVFDLSTLLDPVTSAGWTLTSAVGINNSGQIIAAGLYNGQLRALLLTPMN